jgi:hypothetical protein
MKRLLFGAALGGAAMYFLDPDLGRRRRAIVRDRAARAARIACEAGRVTAVDAAHRARGLLIDARNRFAARPVSDEVLAERARSALGRVVSHPHAIEVESSHGQVTVSGSILAAEVVSLMRRVRGVPGVRGVSERLKIYRQASGVPALQGGRTLHPRFQWLQDEWPPAGRALAGALLGATVVFCLRAASRR